MKKLTVSLIMSLFLFCTGASATSYEEVMESAIQSLYSSNSPEQLVDVANKFSRIAQKEHKEWLPKYYAAYSYIRIAFYIEDADLIDQYLDAAQPYIDAGIEVAEEESELYVLQALLYSMRITSPSRGMKFGGLSANQLEKAEGLNPHNPRVFSCRANNIFHTPAMFGGGKKKALPIFQKADRMFASWEAPSPLWPNWGKDHTKEMLEQCKK